MTSRHLKDTFAAYMDTLKGEHSPNGLRSAGFLRKVNHYRLQDTVRNLAICAGTLLFQANSLSGMFGNSNELEFIADYLPGKQISEALN